MTTITKLDSVVPHRKNAKVRAAVDLPGVPEGTAGKVKIINGMTWLRYWVRFENGEWLGQIDHAHLVPVKDWEDFLRRRDEAASAPQADDDGGEAADVDTPEAAAGGSKVVNGVSVPPHLIERSQKARERLGA